MKLISVSAAALSALVLAGYAAAPRPLPVSTLNGQRIVLSGVSAETGATGLNVSGWAHRERSSHAPLDAQLHIAVLDADGRLLRTAETRWQGELGTSVRHRRPALFRAHLPADDTAARVQISVVRAH